MGYSFGEPTALPSRAPVSADLGIGESEATNDSFPLLTVFIALFILATLCLCTVGTCFWIRQPKVAVQGSKLAVDNLDCEGGSIQVHRRTTNEGFRTTGEWNTA